MYTVFVRDEQGNMKVVHDWRGGDEPAIMGETDMVVISGPVLMMTMVMVELDDPPDVSVAVTVQVSVSPGDTMDGVSVKLASLPRTSPDSFVQA